MDIEMVLNEQSLRNAAPNITVARNWMSDFVHTMSEATKSGVKRVLRAHYDINWLILAPNYSLVQWRNDNSVIREERQFFRALITKVPLLADLQGLDVENRYLLSEFKHEGVITYGLGMAFLLDALAVSVRSEQCWDCNKVVLEAVSLDETGTNYASEVVEVLHASRPEHLRQHSAWIDERLRTSVRDGRDLWLRKSELLPSLIFCEAVREQLNYFHSGHPLFRFVVRTLFQLEFYSKSWNEGSFDPSKLLCVASPESQVTLDRFSRERTFLCPDGQRRLFSWHAKINQGPIRIHFFPDTASKLIIIGYIGGHLPTVNDPT